MEGGGVQWGGFNEDAADYPIRKFSLHFDRERRAASNKDDSRACSLTQLYRTFVLENSDFQRGETHFFSSYWEINFTRVI